MPPWAHRGANSPAAVGALCSSTRGESVAVRSRKGQPNQRLKLTARGGRLVRSWSILSAAAAGRSLSAIR